MLRRALVLTLGTTLVVGVAGATLQTAAAAAAVTVLAGSTPADSPFPDDRWTVADATQQTGRRIALPTAGCGAAGHSLCDDLTLLNTLDGFDLQPRVTIPFSGPVDVLSITPTTVFIEKADGSSGGGLKQLVLDPATNTVSGLTDQFLDPDTRYTLVITNGVKAADGSAVDPCASGCASGATTRRVPFTTMTSTNVLDSARGQLDDASAYTAAGIADADRGLNLNARTDGTRSVFDTGSVVTQVVRHDQVLADPKATGAFKDQNALVTANATARKIGFGSIVSPQYADGEGVIAPVPTTQQPKPLSSARIGVAFFSPDPKLAPSCIQPVIFGPGFTRSKYDVFLAGDAFAGRNIAVFATDPLGHAYGPASTWNVNQGTGGISTTIGSGNGFGRGKDLDGDGAIGTSEGVGPTYTVKKNPDGTVAKDASGNTIPAPDSSPATALVGLRDGLIQTVIDNMALVRALERGVDIDGDGKVDTCVKDGTRPNPVSYYGQSFGGIYGTMLLGTDPELQVGVPNVPGGPIVDIARKSGFRNLLARQIAANSPSLLNGGPGLNGFTESMPLRLDPRIVNPAPGAIALQEYAARGNWIERPGSPETYAPRFKPGAKFGAKKLIFQTAYVDGTVPNPTAGVLYRAGDLYSRVWVYRNDRTPTSDRNPHGFLLDPTLAGRNQGQQQILDFLSSSGATVTDPDGPGPVWENNAALYKVQLDCLHYPDPQTGSAQTRVANTPDCTDSSTKVAAVTPSPGASSASSSPTPSGSAKPSASAANRATLSISTNTPDIQPTQSGRLSVAGQAGQAVQLQCYSRPSTTYATARTATINSAGDPVTFTITPGSNTRCFAQYATNPGSQMSGTVVINVHTTLSLSAVRNGFRNYTFQGRNLPRRSAQLITLYRISNGQEIRTATTTTDSSGTWHINRMFTGSGSFAFRVRTSTTLNNAAGKSSTYTVSVR